MTDVMKQDNTEVPEISYNKEQVDMIKNMYAKDATDNELKLLMYMSKKYGLDILTREIWCVKFQGQPAQIYAGRDGFLEVAHRSGKFDGMESGTKKAGGELVGWCNVYRKDMSHPMAIEVPFDEYNTGKALWRTKPRTMIQKVAESQALRKAFRISGLYGPEEMGQWEEEAKNPGYEPPKTSIATDNKKPTPQAKPKAKPQGNGKGDFDWSKLDLNKTPVWKKDPKTGKTQAPPIVKRLFAIAHNVIGDKDEIETTFQSLTSKEHTWDYTYGDIKKVDEYLESLQYEPPEGEGEGLSEAEQAELEGNV